ncbi:MAG: anthrone oxygenase family protein [Candidatus Eisenbacteria bacterium]
MLLDILQWVTIVLVALVAGVFWGPWLGLSRAMRTLPPETFLSIGQTMIRLLAPIMPVLTILAAIAQVALLVATLGQGPRVASALIAVGLALYLVALIVTLAVEVPIDKKIRAWSAASLPADWKALRDRWERFHTVRTWSALAGFAALVSAVVQ